jgi:hypothetical protein
VLPADPTIPLPKSLYDDLIAAKASLAALHQQQAEQRRAAEQEQARILAQKGEIEAAMKILREQTDQLLASERAAKAATEERAKRYALDGVVERELAPYDFLNSKLRALFAAEVRSELRVEAEGDTFSVRSPDLQPAAAVIAAKLAQPDYQAFLRPKGNPAGGTQPNPSAPPAVDPAAQQRTAPEPSQPAAQPRNLGEICLRHVQEQVDARAAGGDPRLNREVAFGLRVPTR